MKRSALLLTLLASSGCWVTTERGKLMEARLQRLEGESDLAAKQLEEQRAVVRSRVAAVDAKIAEVQKKLDELNAAAHRTGADLAVNQDRLQEEVVRLRGQLEEEGHRLGLLDKALSDLKTDTDARFAALKGAGALDEYEARKKLAQMKVPAEKEGLFELAQAQEAKGERVVARDLYDQYARKYPSDPRTADAHFRIGEILFGDKRYREALLEYGKVVQEFPRSDKAPDALQRTGESMLALDLRDDAKGLFQEVLKRYPKSSAAQRARAQLANMATPRKKPARP